MTNNSKRKQLLGRSFTYARNELHRTLLFHFIKELKKDICYRCGEKINTIEDFTIDHKENWIGGDDPKKLFYSIDNIAFSHSLCNKRAPKTKRIKCPSRAAYKRGCRCEGCILAEKEYNRNYHSKYNKKKK